MPISLLVASSDDHFREMVRENLLNVQNAKIIAEYPEVSANLYTRVPQALERHPDAALVIDLSSDPDFCLQTLEKTKQAAPDLYVIASNFSTEGEMVIATLRAGANDFMVQPIKRIEFRDCMTRLEKAPRHVAAGASKLGKIYTFLGVKGGVGTTTLAVNFARLLPPRNENTVLPHLGFHSNLPGMSL